MKFSEILKRKKNPKKINKINYKCHQIGKGVVPINIHKKQFYLYWTNKVTKLNKLKTDIFLLDNFDQLGSTAAKQNFHCPFRGAMTRMTLTNLSAHVRPFPNLSAHVRPFPRPYLGSDFFSLLFSHVFFQKFWKFYGTTSTPHGTL